jgi:soluble lytic murein transglycosylase-like protein
MKKLSIFIGAFAAILVIIAARRNESDMTRQDGEDIVEAMRRALEETFGAVNEAVTETVETVQQSVFGTKYDSLINSAADAHGVPPRLLYRLLWQESRFRPEIIDGRVRSSTGAMGIAQFMPATAREWLGSEAAALDPAKAIPGAARYLAWLKRQLGTWERATAAYNWGIGNVQRKGLQSAPRETRDYLATVLEGNNYG